MRNDTGATPAVVDLYECLLAYTGSNALTLNNSQYEILEEIMMDAIFQANYWKSIFAIDLWCILGR